MSIIMYIEYIEKFINAVKKGFSGIVTPLFYASKPVRKKSAPQKRKPNKKNNKR